MRMTQPQQEVQTVDCHQGSFQALNFLDPKFHPDPWIENQI